VRVACAQCKVIVFLSTCKQVKFVYEAFRKLRPGVPLRALHGRMKQFKRMAVFYEFCEVTSGRRGRDCSSTACPGVCPGARRGAELFSWCWLHAVL
jgi:hypothetical protein